MLSKKVNFEFKTHKVHFLRWIIFIFLFCSINLRYLSNKYFIKNLEYKNNKAAKYSRDHG